MCHAQNSSGRDKARNLKLSFRTVCTVFDACPRDNVLLRRREVQKPLSKPQRFWTVYDRVGSFVTTSVPMTFGDIRPYRSHFPAPAISQLRGRSKHSPLTISQPSHAKMAMVPGPEEA
jgi:hypothetical protein